MSFDSAAALREAGILGGPMTPELEGFYGSLSQDETQLLISLKNRLNATLPDVVAHGQEWVKPQANQEGFDAAMLCACGLWSGSGDNAQDPG